MSMTPTESIDFIDQVIAELIVNLKPIHRKLLARECVEAVTTIRNLIKSLPSAEGHKDRDHG